MSIIASLLLISIYFYIIFSFSKDWVLLLKQQTILFKFLYIVGLIFPGFLLVFILKDEQYIYTWDYSGYWKKSIHFTSIFFESPIKAFTEVYNSIRHDEYNFAANLLLAPFNKVLGLSFENYIFSVYLVYLVPISLLLTNYIMKVLNSPNKSIFLWLPFISLIFTPFLIPIRFGFIDIVGLIPIFIILNILVKNNFLRTLNYKSSIVIGISIILLVFFRRWYAFWAISFYFSLFIVNTLYSLRVKSYKPFLYSTLNLLIAGLIPTVIILLFFFPFFEMSVLKDYEALYSGYRFSSYSQQFKNFVFFFSPFIIIFSIVGAIVLMKKNKSLLLVLLLSTFILLFLFIRVNDIGGYQHFYLLTPLLVSLFLYFIVNFWKDKKFISIIAITLLVINNIIVFRSNEFPLKNYIFSMIDGTPLIREDYNSILAIGSYLDKLDKEGYYTYCLSSSKILNDDVLKNLKLPTTLNPFKYLLPTKHVDKRDNFPNELFISSYVFVTTPTQIHLQPDAQQLIVYFNNEFENGKFKDHFVVEKIYNLSNNVQAKLLRKIRGFSPQEIEEIKNHFKNLYPEYPNMYDVKEQLLHLNTVRNGDNYGNIKFEGNDILIHPGNERPSEISFDLDSTKIYRLKFNATFRDKENIVNSCNGDNDGEIFLSIYKNNKLYNKSYVTHKKDSIFHLELNHTSNITISVDKGKNQDYCDWFVLSDFELK